MKKQYQTVLIFLLFQTTYVFSQSEKANCCKCSMVLNEVSYFWKLDSLANNGARYFSYKKLLNCIYDSISIGSLVEKIGMPNRVRETNAGIEYIYYYLDEKRMSKKRGLPHITGYISFLYNQNKEKLLSIFEGDFD